MWDKLSPALKMRMLLMVNLVVNLILNSLFDAKVELSKISATTQLLINFV